MKNRGELSRRKFISNAALGSIGTLGATGLLTSCMGSNTKTDELTDGKGLKAGLTLRPYQLLCIFCSIGEGNIEGEDEKIKAIRGNPDIPVKLVCNAGDVFVYQDPGPEDDSHGSPDFNRKRDLEVLQRLDLPPGITLPARIILHRLWDRIQSVSGICGYAEVTSEAWKGCPKAKSGFYEKGCKLCLSFAVPDCGSQLGFSEADVPKARNALIVPRTKEERDKAKKLSLEAMYKNDAVSVRPHILLCAVCQYGETKPGEPQDNLPEMLRFILKNPNAKIKMGEAADWMMCAPCPSCAASVPAPGQTRKQMIDAPCPVLVSKLNACVHVKGHGGLTNQLRDVNVLQRLGLQHGDVVNARELYRRIFERIPSTALVCRISKDVHDPSVWDDGCGQRAVSSPTYDKGREMLMKELGFKI